MPLTTEDHERIEAFRTYIEDYVSTDDRYGPATRHDREQKVWFATRFEVAPTCWFEVAVVADAPAIRVAFVTSDQERRAVIDAAVADFGSNLQSYVASAIAEAGYDWPDAPAEETTQDGLFCYATHVKLDELRDLDNDDIRDNTLRILEGFMLAFAPALGVEEEVD
jgi:hypothetical protein